MQSCIWAGSDAGRGSDWETLQSGSCALGQSCWPGSGSNRAAFVSRGCWSPCDQSCHSLFGQRSQAAGVTRGRDRGLRGSGWEAVEVVDPPPASPLSPLLRDKWHSSSRHWWLITQSALWLVVSYVRYCYGSDTWRGQRGVCGGGLLSLLLYHWIPPLILLKLMVIYILIATAELHC